MRHSDNKKVTLCKLDDGTIEKYDACCYLSDEGFYDTKLFRCIGKGTIYSVDGVLASEVPYAEGERLFYRRIS